METARLKTASQAEKIKLTPDRRKLIANGQDLSFVNIELTDREGTLQPNAENRLQFSVNGPGVIAAVDNANLKDLDAYVGTTRKAWHGRAMVIIKSTKESAAIHLEVTSPGLESAIVKLKTIKDK